VKRLNKSRRETETRGSLHR